MAQLNIVENPTKSSGHRTVDLSDGSLLVDEFLRIYPDGFPAGVTPKIYLDGPLPENEIELLGTERVHPASSYWLVLYPRGIELLVLGFFVSLIVGELVQDFIEDQLDDLLEDLDSSTAGVGSSANNQLRGQRNQIRLGEKIPQIYGEVRSYPDLIDDPLVFYAPAISGDISPGDQSVSQRFLISEGVVLASSFKIGNNLIDLTTDTVTISDPDDGSVSLDIVNTVSLAEKHEFRMDGNGFRINDTNSDVVISITAGTGTITVRTTYAISNQRGAAILLFRMLENFVRPGDSMEIWQPSLTGVTGVFTVDSWELDTQANSGARADLEISVTAASGFTNGTYNPAVGPTFISNEPFYGPEDVTGSIDAPVVFGASDTTAQVNFPRLQDSSRGATSETFAVTISWPRGRWAGGAPINRAEDGTIDVRIIEIDVDGAELAEIVAVATTTIQTPRNGQRYTLEKTIPIVNGRRVAFVVNSDDDGMLDYIGFFNDANRAAQAVQKVNAFKTFLIGAYQLRADVLTLDETIVEVVQNAAVSSQVRSSDKVNLIAQREIPIFNAGTGSFGASAFTRDFADIFMHHAVNVGTVAISQIDFAELYGIQDAINAADPEDGYFSYTFSNKQAALDSELATVCRAARVTLWKEGNTYRFTRDELRAKVGNITSRNILDAGAKSITLSLPDPFDGVILEYIDPTTDKVATIEYPESSTTRLKRMRIPGIRNFDQAWRRVRYEYLKLISQRIGRQVTASREANLWSIGDRLTVFDHTRMEITPLASSGSAFRQDTELQFIDTGDVFVCSERIEVDGTMAAEFFFDHTGDGSIQNILINVDPADARRFTIDPSTAPATITLLVENARRVSDGLQIGERILVYPVAVSANQLTQDDYLIVNKRPDSLGVILELIRYNADLYQFDGVAPP